MYKWKLEFVLKSGKELIAFYENNKDGSFEVAKELIYENDSEIIGCLNDKNKTKQIFVKRSEIVSMTVSMELEED